MFLLKQIVLAAFPAMAMAAALSALLLFRRLNRAQDVLEPLAVGMGYLAGHLVVVGGITFPPRETTNWLPYFALATALWSAFAFKVIRMNWLKWVILSALFAAALRLLLTSKFQHGWSVGAGYFWLILLTGGILLVMLILTRLTQRSELGIEVPLYLLMICAGAFGALSLSGSLLLSQLAVVLGAALFGCLIITWQIRKTEAVLPVCSLLLGALLLSGYFYADLPAASALLIALAPSFALLPISRSPMFRFTVRSSLVAIPILIGLLLAFHFSPPLDY